LKAEKLGFQPRLAVLQQELDHLGEVRLKLVEGCPLGMSPRPTRHLPDVETGVEVSPDDRRERLHVVMIVNEWVILVIFAPFVVIERT
jgi:hypothetical protein